MGRGQPYFPEVLWPRGHSGAQRGHTHPLSLLTDPPETPTGASEDNAAFSPWTPTDSSAALRSGPQSSSADFVSYS